jgi:hypothetical protein
MNVSHINVACCRGAFDRNVEIVNLIHWLENVRPDEDWAQTNKKALPALMPHGAFSSRRADSLMTHSGLVQIDIDEKHQDVGHFDPFSIADELGQQRYVVAAGVSCSSTGVYALVAVGGITQDNHSDKALRAVAHIERTFNLAVDRPVSVNLASLRFASPYAPFINLDVTPFVV